MTAVLAFSLTTTYSAAALVVAWRYRCRRPGRAGFTRVKHDHAFPSNAIAYCLEEAAIGPADLDYVGFYDKPFLKFERSASPPRTDPVFPQSDAAVDAAEAPPPARSTPTSRRLPPWDRLLNTTSPTRPRRFSWMSPFDKAAILTIDGVGEWDTASIGIGDGNRSSKLRRCISPTPWVCSTAPSPTSAVSASTAANTS